MSQRERDRLVVLHQVSEGVIGASEGARRCRLDLRHFRRLRRRFEAEGDGAVVHRARGRRPNNALPEAVRERALAKAGEEAYRDFGPTLLAEHLERDGLIVCAPTLRRWMVEAGLWRVKRQGARHRRRRERRRAWGELVLMDTSIHDWLEGRGGEAMVLIAMIDDATSRLFCRFFPRDTGAANRQLIVSYLERFGRMGALYTDRAGHFEAHFRAAARRAQDLAKATTLIRRGLDALEIELILALSPQAKGRVERLFGTLQDRLVKEMRIARVASMAEANRFLEEQFIPFWNARFTAEPADAADAHRPLVAGTDLLRLFAEAEQRVIKSDFTFRYQNRHYQIEKGEADGRMPKTCVTIEERLDGSRHVRWQEHTLSPTPLADPPRRDAPAATSTEPAEGRPQRRGGGRPPPANHPWRQYPIRVGKGVARPPTVVASAPAALRPDTSAA